MHGYMYIQCTFYVKRQPSCQGSCSLWHLETKCTVLVRMTSFHYKRVNTATVIGELLETTSLKWVCVSSLTSKHIREVHFVDE